jgi:hypothetical protein
MEHALGEAQMSNRDENSGGIRRLDLLLVGTTAAITADTARGQATSPMSEQIPIYYPRTEFVYEAVVDIAAGMDLGAGPLGRRAMVPITRGTFEGPIFAAQCCPAARTGN